jgi:hypothetical protein
MVRMFRGDSLARLFGKKIWDNAFAFDHTAIGAVAIAI